MHLLPGFCRFTPPVSTKFYTKLAVHLAAHCILFVFFVVLSSGRPYGRPSGHAFSRIDGLGNLLEVRKYSLLRVI